MAQEACPEVSRTMRQSRRAKYSSAGNLPNGDSIVQQGVQGEDVKSVFEIKLGATKFVSVSVSVFKYGVGYGRCRRSIMTIRGLRSEEIS